MKFDEVILQNSYTEISWGKSFAHLFVHACMWILDGYPIW